MAGLAKNASVPGSSAAGDLGVGLGDNLQSQASAEIIARRKKALALGNQVPAAYGALAMGTSLNSGAGNTSFAFKALMGQGGFNG